MNRPFSVLNILSVLVCAAVAGIALMMIFHGPTGPIPVHFGLDGSVDRWGDRTEVGGFLALLAVIALVPSLGIGWEASRHEPGSSRSRGLRAAQAVILISVVAATGLILFVSLNKVDLSPPHGALMGGMGLLFAGIGAFLGRVGPNPFVGVRTPWTYKSRLAWDRSNRLAGRLFFLGGLVAIVAAHFASQPAGMTTLIVFILASGAWSVLESWRVWRDDPDRQPF